MYEEFWQARWSRSEIGFHLPEVNPYLQRYWPALGLPEGARVLVPFRVPSGFHCNFYPADGDLYARAMAH